MAQRQLTLLARRLSRPFASSLHRLVRQDSVQHCLLGQAIFDIEKIGIRSFSAGPRLPQRPGGAGKGTAGGKGTEPPGSKGIECPEKASDQKQSVGKASVPPAADKVTPPQAESSTSSRKSSTKYILIVGACSAIVVGVLTLYPRDFLKSVNLGKKDEKGSKGSAIVPKITAPPTSKEDTSVDNTAHPKEDAPVDNLTHLQASKEQGKKAPDEQDSNPKVDIDATVDQTKTDSESPEESPPADTTDAHRRVRAISANEGSVSDFSIWDQSPEVKDHQGPPAVSATDEGISGPVLVVSKEVLPRPEVHLPTIPKNSFKESINDKVFKSVKEPSSNLLKRPSLLEAYHLTNMHRSSADMQLKEDTDDSSSDKYDITIRPLKVKKANLDGVISGANGEGEHSKAAHNAVDVVELLHAAEKRQAELDAHDRAEAEKKLKQAYQREVKDAQAKQLMYAEEANRLAKEIEIEKDRADAALKLEQEKASERLQRELDMKEEETDLKLKKADVLAKAEIAAAVAQEKLSYLKDVKDVKQELEALYKAFFAQSEEVHQSHTVHKLAVGTFALEDAMRRGAPIEREVALLCSSYGGAGSDPLLDAALSSLPKTVVQKGTMTPAQLHQKFENMKSLVLELSLLQPSGSGLLSHVAAKVVSALKVKENGQYSDGIDSVVSQVQKCVADGKLAEAAELLEKSVKGTEAEQLVADWVQSARDRAVMEQVLLLLQAHSTAVASSLA